MRRAAVAAALALLVPALAACEPAPPYAASVHPVQASDVPSSWRPGCPVGPEQLRLVRLTHVGFDGKVHEGELVVHADVASTVVEAFRAAYDARFRIERMERVDVYGGDDGRSMAANNTSAFNCRTVGGTTRWSEHAYGRAIDVNPVQNPYVRGGTVDPPAGRAYTNRDDRRQGMLVGDSPLVQAVKATGWGWGGDWRSSKDYQHLSATGR